MRATSLSLFLAAFSALASANPIDPATGDAKPVVTEIAAAGYQLAFSDEFNGAELDRAKWDLPHRQQFLQHATARERRHHGRLVANPAPKGKRRWQGLYRRWHHQQEHVQVRLLRGADQGAVQRGLAHLVLDEKPTPPRGGRAGNRHLRANVGEARLLRRRDRLDRPERQGIAGANTSPLKTCLPISTSGAASSHRNSRRSSSTGRKLPDTTQRNSRTARRTSGSPPSPTRRSTIASCPPSRNSTTSACTPRLTRRSD